MSCLFQGGERFVYVVAGTRIKGAQSIGLVLNEAPIRAAMLDYAERTIITSLFLSLMTAVLVFLSLYFILVRPMARFTRAMVTFRENPEDPAHIVAASNRKDEIGVAERELAAMQRDLYASLQQKNRLAALGAAMARIQHDLRNILSNAQLASDRLAALDDPMVKRLAPRLVSSIDRAVALATRTLRYGRAAEPAPERRALPLAPLIEEAVEAALAPLNSSVDTIIRVDAGLHAEADSEQLFRIVLNLIRNAAEAIGQAEGQIQVNALRQGAVTIIDVCDTGPGIPANAREKLFKPFATVSKGGSGLGLAIARELARAHGGDVTLFATSGQGTVFRVTIPDISEN
jgi:signal transduction histidine kinase